MKNSCPPVTVNVDAIVEAVKKDIVREKRVEADVHSAGVRGLGEIRLVPHASDFDGTSFVLGYSLVPPAINFLSRLSDEGILLPKIDKALFRGIATGLNLVAQLLTGRSFLLGSLIGQIPTTMDSLADVAVTAVKSARGGSTAVVAEGIGASPEEELLKLRRDLEKAVSEGSEPAAVSGISRGREVVFR